MKSQQELEQIREYERRLHLGEKPAALVKKVDLKTIAGAENYQRVIGIEGIEQNTCTSVRGVPLTFHTPSQRLLWQAFGQEHIEPELLNFIDSIPEDEVYYDIGASNGLFALYAAATGKRVICFEPEVANFSLLNLNTFLNKSTQRHPVSNFNVALSDTNGLGKMFIQKFEAGGHLKILDNPVKRGAKDFEPDFVQSVMRYELDAFIDFTDIPRPNYVKIDVDGCEPQVLRGMSKVLASSDLKKVFIELEESGPHFDVCHGILMEHGFRIDSRKRVQNYFGEENMVFSR
ncbi:FkbM family methyltransferase [Paraburkholderia strydomiana]|uniref:FkbM family methyltransferase n=1 Tax=Paraburkholderia strydomiana TaxID=1245417 RepID=UPI00286144CA|nr:FkbM family methyltransferase [Paraburkholderia strydomiana]MDR7010069.1 FkbM family methyltransferase [Paraburkholderia strydomiana]